MKLSCVFCLLLSILIPSVAEAADKPTTSPRRVILDTDMLTDCDDAGAMAMLHALEDRGEISLLGVLLNGVDSTGKHSAVVSAINTHFGRDDLPIGVTQRAADTSPQKSSSYAPAIWDEFPHDGKRDADRPAALEVYRELLSAAPEHSVTIISIGFLTNLDDLLRDEQGIALIQSKVKRLVVMGGAYPSGKEYNFRFANAANATGYVLENWPNDVPIVFTGYELGEIVKTGKGYQAAPPSPMKRCYELAYNSINKGRPSWDQTAVLFAARGVGHEGKTYFREVAGGYNVLHADGRNEWVTSENSNHRHTYLQLATTADALAAEIEALMVAPPKHRK